MPFVKGQSGNPAGLKRARVVVDGEDGPVEMTLAELARTHTVEAVEVIVSIMRNRAAGTKERREAAKLLIERGWGRPKQEIELSGVDGAPIAVEGSFDVSVLSTDELRQLETIRGKLGTGDPAAA